MQSNFSTNFKKHRQECGFSQGDIAKLLNTTRQNVGSWETGRTEPTFAQLAAVAQVLGCSADDLLRPTSNEFFYIDEAGNKSDAAMHEEMLAHEDSPETKAHLLAGIRKRLTDEQIRRTFPNLIREEAPPHEPGGEPHPL